MMSNLRKEFLKQSLTQQLEAAKKNKLKFVQSKILAIFVVCGLVFKDWVETVLAPGAPTSLSDILGVLAGLYVVIFKLDLITDWAFEKAKNLYDFHPDLPGYLTSVVWIVVGYLFFQNHAYGTVFALISSIPWLPPRAFAAIGKILDKVRSCLAFFTWRRALVFVGLAVFWHRADIRGFTHHVTHQLAIAGTEGWSTMLVRLPPSTGVTALIIAVQTAGLVAIYHLAILKFRHWRLPRG